MLTGSQKIGLSYTRPPFSSPAQITRRVADSDQPQQQRHQAPPTAAATAAGDQLAAPAARRDLIREYFARNATPPAIFRPSFQAFSPPPVLQLAYTHPALLLLDDDDDDANSNDARGPNGGRRPADKAAETDRAVDETFVSGNSVEMLLDAATVGPERSPPPPSFRLRRSAFSSIDLSADAADGGAAVQSQSPGDAALPAGTVTANLIRTWEQLNAANAPAAAVTPVSATQPMLRAPVPLPRRSTATAASRVSAADDNDFYDSIDDDDDDDQFVSELERIPSMCCENGDDDELECGAVADGDVGAMAVAGEAMAQFESLDKRKICWSMDSV